MIKDRWNRLFGREKKRGRNTRALSGGRITMQDPYRAHTFTYLSPPERSQSVFSLKNWSEEELLNLPVDKLMKILPDISPEVSKAYSDFLRHGNEGWYYEVDPISLTPVLDDFIGRMEAKHHDFDVLIDKIYAGIFLRGAIFIELILNETADMPVDIAVLDPIVARFQREKQTQNWRLGQWQEGKWNDLEDDPTVMYVPFNSTPDSPWGKSMMSSSPVDVIRQLGVMNDFRRVLESQGWARTTFSIDSKKLEAFMPQEIKGDVDAEDEFIRDFIGGLNSTYSNLKPNEAWGVLDIVTVEMPKGGQMQTSFFGLVDGLMRLYDRRIGRATGSTPIKQHSNENVSETHAREQRNDYRINIESIQSTVAGTLSTLFKYGLQSEGKKGSVNFHFENTLDPLDVKALEETEGIKLENLKLLKELRDMDGIDDADYDMALNQWKAEKHKHSSSIRTIYNPTDSHNCTGCPECDPAFTRDTRAATISPDGSEDPLPVIPAEFAINAVFLESAIDTFDTLFTDYRDLLNAQVTGMTATDAIDTVKKGNWVWNQLTKRYRNSKTKKTVSSNTLLTLRDDLVDDLRGTFGSMTDDLVNGRQTVQQWLYEMRTRTRDAYNSQYMLAKGGRNAIFQSDLDLLTDIVSEQYDYLQGFAEEVRRGGLSAKQITARAEMYIEGSTSAHERGKASSFGIELPEYPADGNQICLSRCRCRWEIEEGTEETRAYWLTNIAATHCDSCLTNTARYAPYRIPN